MTKFPDAFERATGERLYPGTINVEVLDGEKIAITEHFQIPDPIDRNQVLLFERCRINGITAYRIRPYNIHNGMGGWGDHILEISSARFIPDAKVGMCVTLEFQ